MVKGAVWVLVPALLAWAPQPAPSTLLSENFDGALPAAWVIANSDPSVGWAADGNPSATFTPFVSAPNSMNYNNGTDYAEGTTSSGTVTSPAVNLTGTTSGQLVFSCNYETETPWAASFDDRRLQISNNDFASTVYDQPFGEVGAVAEATCAAMGTWHTHTIPLQATWGTIKVRWSFDTLDGLFNTYAGWFVDNVLLTAVVPPTAPNTPATLEQAVSQGGPVVPPGYVSTTGVIWLRATVSDINATDTVQIEAEVKPSATPFDGLGLVQGNAVSASGGVSEVSVSLGNGQYKWRARAVDSNGMTSPWIEYDPPIPADFVVVLPGSGPDNDNGDLGINDRCSGSVRGPGAALWGLLVLAAILVSLKR